MVTKTLYTLNRWKLFIHDLSKDIVNNTDFNSVVGLADLFGIKYEEDFWGGIVEKEQVKKQTTEKLFEVLYEFWKDKD